MTNSTFTRIFASIKSFNQNLCSSLANYYAQPGCSLEATLARNVRFKSLDEIELAIKELDPREIGKRLHSAIFEKKLIPDLKNTIPKENQIPEFDLLRLLMDTVDSIFCLNITYEQYPYQRERNIINFDFLDKYDSKLKNLKRNLEINIFEILASIKQLIKDESSLVQEFKDILFRLTTQVSETNFGHLYDIFLDLLCKPDPALATN